MMVIHRLSVAEVIYLKAMFNINCSQFRNVPEGLCSEITYALLGDEDHTVVRGSNKEEICIYRRGYMRPHFISLNNGASFLAPFWGENRGYTVFLPGEGGEEWYMNRLSAEKRRDELRKVRGADWQIREGFPED